MMLANFNLIIMNMGEDMGQQELLDPVGGSVCKVLQALGKHCGITK